MVSRRTEREYQPYFTKAGTGKLFYEPAAGPQQQRQDRWNEREQGFKEQLQGKMSLQPEEYPYGTPGEQIVNNAFATRGNVVRGHQSSGFQVRGPRPGREGDAMPDWGWPRGEGHGSNDSRYLLEGIPDMVSGSMLTSGRESKIDNVEVDVNLAGAHSTVPGSIVAMPQRTMERDLTDNRRARMPGEERAAGYRGKYPVDEERRGGGHQKNYGRDEVTGRVIGQPRMKSPIFPDMTAEHLTKTETPEGETAQAFPGQGFPYGGDDYKDLPMPAAQWLSDRRRGLKDEVNQAVDSVVTNRMARTLARRTEMNPEDLQGLNKFQFQSTDSGYVDAPGWYETQSSDLHVRDPLDPQSLRTTVHEMGHHVSTRSPGYNDRQSVGMAVSRDLRKPEETTSQRPREEAFADDYRSMNLKGNDTETGYRYTDAYFSSPGFAAEYDAAREVPDRGDADRQGRLGLLRAEMGALNMDDDNPTRSRTLAVVEGTRQRLGSEPRGAGQPTLFDRDNEIYPERLPQKAFMSDLLGEKA